MYVTTNTSWMARPISRVLMEDGTRLHPSVEVRPKCGICKN